MELKEYDDIQQKAGSSILMGVALMDFWHVAEFCLNSRSGIISVGCKLGNGLVSYHPNVNVFRVMAVKATVFQFYLG